MANPKNEKQVAALRDLLAGKAKTFFVVDYQGLSAGELSALRKKVREAGGRLLVAKNTLINVVLKDDEISDFGDILHGPTALVLVDDDPVAPAKAITDYVKAHAKNLPNPKGGMLQGKKIAGEALESVAKMPSRQQLLSEFVGVLQAPMQQLVGVLEGAPRNLVSVLQNYADKQKEAQ
ncbi:MAG: 50S ribosomal protein L10 [Deinococcales bacterium]